MSRMRKFIALDTETTGVTNDDRIIEIYAVVVDPSTGSTGESFSMRCNPDRQSHPKAFEKHRISDAELLTAERFQTRARKLLSFLSGHQIIAHNVKFDSRMLQLEFARVDPDMLSNANINFSCSMLAAQEILRKKEWPSLDFLCDRFEIDRSAREKRHAAQLDVELLTKALPKLSELYRESLARTAKRDDSFFIGVHSDAIFAAAHGAALE